MLLRLLAAGCLWEKGEEVRSHGPAWTRGEEGTEGTQPRSLEILSGCSLACE